MRILLYVKQTMIIVLFKIELFNIFSYFTNFLRNVSDNSLNREAHLVLQSHARMHPNTFTRILYAAVFFKFTYYKNLSILIFEIIDLCIIIDDFYYYHIKICL